MALLDQPVPARMQGRVPSALVVDPPRVAEYDSVGDPADSSGDSGSDGPGRPEDDAMLDRLENLGYR